MLNIFFNDKDKAKIRMFRTAYYKDESENKTSFRFCIIEREDYNAIEVLRNIQMEEGTITIRTVAPIPFKVHDKILIDGKLYAVSSIYKENQECANGIFRKNVQPFVYLILRH